jgi:hypothetical protein
LCWQAEVSMPIGSSNRIRGYFSVLENVTAQSTLNCEQKESGKP